MGRVVGIVVAAALVVGCSPGALVSKDDALRKVVREAGVAHIDRREAKLMAWPDFLRVSNVQARPEVAPAGKQKVWVVAVAGDMEVGPKGSHERWAIFVYNAVSGDRIGFISGPYSHTTGEPAGPDWPPYWADFPDTDR